MPGTTSKQEFSEQLHSVWLPSFCEARDETIAAEWFDDRNLMKLSEEDARNFLRAVNEGYVTEYGGFFVSELSSAKEQIFWEGNKAAEPRRISLWLEPIITIGALARLIDEYQWPASQVGLQSRPPWPFDLMGYGTTKEVEILACEIKKSSREVDRLVEYMRKFSMLATLDDEPTNSPMKNAYRKIVGIRRSWPAIFWALGPSNYGYAFEIKRERNSDRFTLNPVEADRLNYRHNR